MAAVIRHALAEGWLLFRQRWLISVTLAFALAIPICLAGFTLTLTGWLEPLAEATGEAQVVPILLHPHMDEAQRQAWLDDLAARHPDWRVRRVPPAELAQRLVHWFPYLSDLLKGDSGGLLPPLVEVTAHDPSELDGLAGSPAVIAIGPRSSLRRFVETAVTHAGWLLGLVSLVLLASTGLLAAIWVHLELYRHGDEITIMRLVGATEAAIQGPFLVAIALPAGAAGALAIGGTLALAEVFSRLAAALGLPPLVPGFALLAGEAAVSFALPLAAAAFTLARHAVTEIEG